MKKLLVTLTAVSLLALSLVSVAAEETDIEETVGQYYTEDCEYDGEGPVDGSGYRHGAKEERGNGEAFVDEDGDGICDYLGEQQGAGRQEGSGTQGRSGTQKGSSGESRGQKGENGMRLQDGTGENEECILD